MMRALSFILAYYDNPTMLAHQYDFVGALPDDLRRAVRMIVVDDASPDAPACPPPDIGNWPDGSLTIVRMLEDVPWNQDACRNLGVNLSKTEWLLLTDMDHLVPRETFERVISDKGLKTDAAYQFTRQSSVGPIDVGGIMALEPYKHHPNTWFMARQLYDRVGGYDERFAGSYGTDGDFRGRLLAAGVDVVHLNSHIIRVGREIVPDASTTAFPRKTEEGGARIKQIKKDRDSIQNWKTVRFQFPWKRVYPCSPS